MISTQDIKNKEVINIYDGRSLGFAEDIEVDLERGTIEGIIVPESRSFFSFFGRSGEQVIRWRDIRRIGDDVILVDVAGTFDSGYGDTYNAYDAYRPQDGRAQGERYDPQPEQSGAAARQTGSNTETE